MKQSTLIDQSLLSTLSSLDSYDACKRLLFKKGYKNLGWLNDGITIPEHYHCDRVYSNRSGTSCLYADHLWKVFYSVDMGD